MPNVVKRADVRMVQAGDRLGLALEPPLQVGIGRDVCGEDFDGDGAVQAGIAGFVDFAHSSCADRREDFVWPELRPNFKRHA
jgi:hypothetical protein